MKRIIVSIGLILIGALLFSGNVFAITVDGNMSDWGVVPAGYGPASDWIPYSGVDIYYTVEDQKGDLNTFLGPGYGGQKFDAEAMYFKRENDNLYLAIVTGMRVGGRAADGTRYYAGDIAIDFNGDTIFEYGIKTLGADKGKLYKDLTASSWKSGRWNGQSGPISIKNGAGTLVGSTNFFYGLSYYNSSDYTNDHSVIEIEIPDSYFGDDWMNNGNLHWTETCGNDVLDLRVPGIIPEPASLSLLGLGLAGLLRFRRRKRNI